MAMWWPLFGLTRLLTERRTYRSEREVRPLPTGFSRSLFIYPLDVGNDNLLNMDLAALKSPQYNIHHLGVFFADAPRHADVLLLLGYPVPELREPIHAALEQMPRPFGVVWLRGGPRRGDSPEAAEVPEWVENAGGSMIAVVEEPEGPAELIGILLRAMGRNR